VANIVALFHDSGKLGTGVASFFITKRKLNHTFHAAVAAFFFGYSMTLFGNITLSPQRGYYAQEAISALTAHLTAKYLTTPRRVDHFFRGFACDSIFGFRACSVQQGKPKHW
jgi:tellurite resistance protein TehA-like permease